MIPEILLSGWLTLASFYGPECHGKLMANGKPFDMNAMTCASWDYPFNTKLRVTHEGKSVEVVVTDRGPAKRLCAQGRKLDLSRAAFAKLAPLERGVIQVKVEVTK